MVLQSSVTCIIQQFSGYAYRDILTEYFVQLFLQITNPFSFHQTLLAGFVLNALKKSKVVLSTIDSNNCIS